MPFGVAQLRVPTASGQIRKHVRAAHLRASATSARDGATLRVTHLYAPSASAQLRAPLARPASASAATATFRTHRYTISPASAWRPHLRSIMRDLLRLAPPPSAHTHTYTVCKNAGAHGAGKDRPADRPLQVTHQTNPASLFPL